jgi:hypothetical protein
LAIPNIVLTLDDAVLEDLSTSVTSKAPIKAKAATWMVVAAALVEKSEDTHCKTEPPPKKRLVFSYGMSVPASVRRGLSRETAILGTDDADKIVESYFPSRRKRLLLNGMNCRESPCIRCCCLALLVVESELKAEAGDIADTRDRQRIVAVACFRLFLLLLTVNDCIICMGRRGLMTRERLYKSPKLSDSTFALLKQVWDI